MPVLAICFVIVDYLGTTQVSRHFHVGEEVAALGTSIFLFGFGLGPLLWAPLSEVYGRRLAVLVPMCKFGTVLMVYSGLSGGF